MRKFSSKLLPGPNNLREFCELTAGAAFLGAAIGVVLFAVATFANAQSVSTFVQGSGAPAYVGPGDAAAYNPGSILGYWSPSEGYSAAVANSGAATADITRSSDSSTTTVHLDSTGWADAAITAFGCNPGVVNCTVQKLYGQAGTDAALTNAAGPQLDLVNGHYTIKCAGILSNDHLNQTVGITAPTKPVTYAYVIQPNNTTATVFANNGSGNGQLEFGESAGKFSLFNGARLAGSAFSSGSTYVGAGIFGTTTSGATESSSITSNVTTSNSAGTSALSPSQQTCSQTNTTAHWMHLLVDDESMTGTQISNGYTIEQAKWAAQ